MGSLFTAVSCKIFRTAVNNTKVLRSVCKALDIFCSIVTKFGDCRQILVKVTNTKFHKNPSSESRADECGRTDGRTNRDDEANRRFPRLIQTGLKISK